MIIDLKSKKTLNVKFEYDRQLVSIINTISGRRYNPTNKSWELPITAINELLDKFPNAVISNELKLFLQSKEQEKEKIELESKAIIDSFDFNSPLLNKKQLFSHQIEGIKKMIMARRIILADDMGLGKTLQALVSSKLLADYYNYKIIVICPVSTIENWRREAKSLGLEIEAYSWAKQPSSKNINYDFILIGDEAHYIQAGNKSLRGKQFLELSKSNYCKACFCITGTPIKNGRPINLFPLLKAINHELSFDKFYYLNRYCEPKIKTYGRLKFRDYNGASNLSELHYKIKNIMIRRTKEECLDLPSKIRVLRKAELSKDAERLYADTLEKLRKEYKRRLQEGIINTGGEALVMLQHLAHAGAMGKIETAYELAEEVVEENNQAVIFSTFIAPLLELKKKFDKSGISCSMLTGDVKDRQTVVDDFLNNKTKVLLLSMAGGIGIDLYSANTIILINRAWTPGDVIQIEDRLHRIGQRNNVTSIWLQYGEVDEHVDSILENKAKNISEILNDDNDEIIKFAVNYFKK